MENEHNRNKEPWLAVVLSSFWPGVGQIYSRRIRRGSMLILAEAVLAGLGIWSLLSAKCDILVMAGIYLALWAIWIWNLFDAHRCARITNPEGFEATRKQSKDAWLALFLSDLIPGLGQMYVRRWLWGIVFILAAVFVLAIGIKYPLVRSGLWAAFSAVVCYHAYVSAPVRREKSRRTILIIAAAILCSYLLSGYQPHAFRTYVVEAFRIPTGAMKPTLVPGDRFFVRKSSRYIPERGDVVVFKPPDDPDTLWTKRVAALSGETIEIEDKTIYIDGKKIQYPAFQNIESLPDDLGLKEPYKVPENCFFVLGDNIANSNDSRFFGAIPLSDLIGKAYKIYWPLSRRGPIK